MSIANYHLKLLDLIDVSVFIVLLALLCDVLIKEAYIHPQSKLEDQKVKLPEQIFQAHQDYYLDTKIDLRIASHIQNRKYKF